MNTIGFIGIGALALYTIKGVRHGGYREPILLSPRNAENAQFLASQHRCEIAVDNQAVVDNCRHVLIATRPEDCLQTLSALRFKAGQVLISVVAGLTIEKLRSAVPAGVDILRAMPVSSAEAGASPTLVFPQHDFAESFFNHCGQSIPVDNENYFTQGTVLACVYCWFFSLFESLIEVTQGPDLPRELSAQLVMGMAGGAAQMALASKDSPGEIATSIATAGTFSKQGLDLLQAQAAFESWREACELLQRQLAVAN